ncbi:uncharacterized protein LOC127033743 isoform X6 [Gopherus flavomarginatus]|uniref:uncharacterized protein LOC127033743 isoform X6 n=1 Tax=Gopherus flavomarginatus TaxID=286002 RepID=UPI0021CC4196|nr:uncharacterized protein LOC127033743 isoform X6 [Gopherus flavomarginatus]
MNMKSRHDADIALALSNIAKAQEKQQRHYAKRKTSKYGEITFEVGDSVLLLNARQRTRKGGVLESKYRGPYKIMSVEGKRVKLQTISGKQLGTMYSIAHLKPVKEPTTLAAESTSEGKTGTEIGVGDTEPETPTEEIREVDGTVSHDSKVENIEVTAIEKEEYIGQDVSNNDTSDADDSFDDMLTEEVEDKQWLLKVKLVMTSKHTERLEAKVRNIKLYGSSFHCLKPRSWISDEIALMKKKELLIIDPLCDEIRYERTCLRNWRNFIKRLTSKSSSDWNSKIVQHPRQSDGHSCGPLILKFAETYLQHKDISTVETTQKANTAFRRHIAILLMKESAWRTTAYTATLLTVKKKVRIARWSSVILARGGHIYHALQKEPIKKTSHVRRKSTNARHVHSSLHYQKKKKAIKKTHCLTASCSKHNATQRNIFLCIHQIIINVFDVK